MLMIRCILCWVRTGTKVPIPIQLYNSLSQLNSRQCCRSQLCCNYSFDLPWETCQGQAFAMASTPPTILWLVTITGGIAEIPQRLSEKDNGVDSWIQRTCHRICRSKYRFIASSDCLFGCPIINANAYWQCYYFVEIQTIASIEHFIVNPYTWYPRVFPSSVFSIQIL